MCVHSVPNIFITLAKNPYYTLEKQPKLNNADRSAGRLFPSRFRSLVVSFAPFYQLLSSEVESSGAGRSKREKDRVTFVFVSDRGEHTRVRHALFPIRCQRASKWGVCGCLLRNVNHIFFLFFIVRSLSHIAHIRDTSVWWLMLRSTKVRTKLYNFR